MKCHLEAHINDERGEENFIAGGIKFPRKHKLESRFLPRATRPARYNPLSFVANYFAKTPPLSPRRAACTVRDKDALYYFQLNFDSHYPTRVSPDIISTAKQKDRSGARAPFLSRDMQTAIFLRVNATGKRRDAVRAGGQEEERRMNERETVRLIKGRQRRGLSTHVRSQSLSFAPRSPGGVRPELTRKVRADF